MIYKAIKRREEFVMHTLQQMQMRDFEYYSHLFLQRIRLDRFYTAYILNDRKYIKEIYRELKKYKALIVRLLGLIF